MSRNKPKGRLPAGGWVWLGKAMADTAAWRKLSPGGKCLYLALKRHLSNDHSNNGRVFLSVRDAAKQVGSNKDSIQRWFLELQHYGFIVQTSPGKLGSDGRGVAPYWRLTEIDCGGDLATRDYQYWSGEKFRKGVHGSGLLDMSPIVGTVPDAPYVPNSGDSQRGVPVILAPPTVPESGDTLSPIVGTGSCFFSGMKSPQDHGEKLPWSTPHIEEMAA